MSLVIGNQLVDFFVTLFDLPRDHAQPPGCLALQDRVRLGLPAVPQSRPLFDKTKPRAMQVFEFVQVR